MTDFLEQNKEPPKTIEGIGIYIHFMGKEIDRLNKNFEGFTTNYVPISQYIELKEMVVKQAEILELHDRYMEGMKGKVWGVFFSVSCIAGIISFLVSNFWHK